MSNLRSAAKQALNALEKAAHAMQTDLGSDEVEDAIGALNAALMQPEPLELVANLLEEYGLQALDVVAALREQQDAPVAIRWRWPGYKWTYEDYSPDFSKSGSVESQILYIKNEQVLPL